MGPAWLVFAQIVVIIDGDTLKLDGERVRLIGVDAPEIFHAHCEEELRRGHAARAFLVTLTQGRTLALQRSGTDRYGRTLATVFAEGIDLNAAMIESGHARIWRKHNGDWCGR